MAPAALPCVLRRVNVALFFLEVLLVPKLRDNANVHEPFIFMT